MKRVGARLSAAVQRALIGVLKLYKKYISPQLGTACRFYPTCSQYAMTAIERFGPLRGSFMSIVRLLKCQPFHPGGYDPVPERESKTGHPPCGHCAAGEVESR